MSKNYCDGCLRTFDKNHYAFDLPHGYIVFCPECYEVMKKKFETLINVRELGDALNEIQSSEGSLSDTAHS